MFRDTLNKIAKLLLLVLVPISAAHAGECRLFATTGDEWSGGTLYPRALIAVDPDTASSTEVGPPYGVMGSTKMDWSPLTGTLFGIDPASPGNIQEIDPDTGIASDVATIYEDWQLVTLRALSVAPDGILYGMTTSYRLGTIELDTETFTPLFNLPAENVYSYSGMDFTPDGLLYVAGRYVEPQYAQFLILLDVENQEILEEISVDTRYVDDITFAPDGYIYHTNASWALIRLDPTTGAQKNVGYNDHGAMRGIGSISGDSKSLLEDLIAYVLDLQLSPGLENSLIAKLEVANNILRDRTPGNDSIAIKMLQDFIDLIDSNRGKRLSGEEANNLKVFANDILELLVCALR